jgi:hypothetical protein
LVSKILIPEYSDLKGSKGNLLKELGTRMFLNESEAVLENELWEELQKRICPVVTRAITTAGISTEG